MFTRVPERHADQLASDSPASELRRHESMKIVQHAVPGAPVFEYAFRAIEDRDKATIFRFVARLHTCGALFFG